MFDSSYGEMVDLMESLHDMEIERLIEEGIISSAADFDPEADYRTEELDNDLLNYSNYNYDYDSYAEENYY